VIAAALLACAVNIAPTTLEAVIQVESRGDPLLLYVNGLGAAQPRHAADAKEAAALARAYIAQGYPVVSETLMYQDFVVISRQKKNRTTIYPPYNDDFLTEENQTVIPYQDITSFQHEDKDMFINRLQKIMMLA